MVFIMTAGQNINANTEAPANLLDMKGGGAPDVSNPLQSQAIKEMSSPTGSLLAGMDGTVNEALQQGDRAEAALAGDKPMAVDQQANLVSIEGGKQYLNIPPIQDTYSAPQGQYNTSAAKEAFDRLFDPKKTNAAA